MTDSLEIVQNPDRENIELFLQRIKYTVPVEDTFFYFLMLLLKERKTQQHCEQYLIFCPAISTCSKLYKIFRIKFKENVELLDHVEMYHSKAPDDVKQLVTDDMGNEKGIIRILIGTSAAGIGVNFKGVQYTINYGCPTDMDSFVQQYGRAGKDGGYSVFMLIYTK